ncbi:MAG: segregation/condensation protein A [bacterium]|nr:segregation/condensation protein A [bacterium]
MPHEIKLEKFEGPLDLLLQLIEQEKMSITEIALSKITEQFLEYLDKMGDDRSDNLADFLVIATRLVYLKSKNLLPYLLPPDEDDGPGLAEQLKLYKQFIVASGKINILWQAGSIAYGRVEPPVKVEGFTPPTNARVNDLYTAMVALVKRLQPLRPLQSMQIDRTISIKQKIASIRELLTKIKSLSFKDILQNAENKTEVIVSFLALLELVKDETIKIKQKDAYADLFLEKN